MPPAAPSLTRGRVCIAMAALLWSTSGAFTKLLTQPTGWGLDQPPVEPLSLGGHQLPVQIAFYRALFAGLFLVPTLRPGQIRFRPAMLWMGASFALMNALYISAQALGTVANAVLLQYTAPMWMYLACVWWLGEAPDRRNTVTLGLGMCGVAVIVAGGWGGEQLTVVLLALGSGVACAAILLGLRVLRDLPSGWLTVWNHLWGAALLLPFVLALAAPTLPQMALLVLFGSLQLGLPYYLMARGLRSVSPQEAGAITLLEPLLNPVWAYVVSPETEAPSVFTLVGGALIVGGLAWRYWPSRVS